MSKDELIVMLMELTFGHSDETAKPIVDNFIKSYPEILDYFELDFLYSV